MAWNTSRIDRWLSISLGALLVIAIVLRMTLGGAAGAIAVRVAGGALLVVVPWLLARRLIPQVMRQTIEDKIVRDFRAYLSNPLPEMHPPVLPPCDFRMPAAMTLQIPNPDLVVVDVLPPRCQIYTTMARFDWPHAA